MAGHIKRAKQLLTAAVDAGFLDRNPFRKQKAGVQKNDARKQYIPAEVIDAVLDIVPCPQWRLMIALARYAGLRTPSETFRLQWSDVLWNRGRIRVTAPKTERHGKGIRYVPITPQLRPWLQEAFDLFGESEFVISRYRDADANLRTQFQRYIEQAGQTSWPRLWQNLRASFETDLVKEHPAHVAAAWLGHSPTVAATHYLTVTDADFERASEVGQGVGQTLHEAGGNERNSVPTFGPLSRKTSKNTGKTKQKVGPEGLEPPTKGL